jgi:hypothetical protein
MVLKLSKDGEEVNVDYEEDVNYVLGLECKPDLPCEHEDVKTIKCTINGCEEVIPVVSESQDAIAADQGLIVTPDVGFNLQIMMDTV